VRREKKMRNRIDLLYGLVEEKYKRNRRERESNVIFSKDKNTLIPNKKKTN